MLELILFASSISTIGFLGSGVSKWEWVGGLFWIGGIGVCGMSTGADSSFSEELGTNDSVSGLVLSNNSLYNLYSFIYRS